MYEKYFKRIFDIFISFVSMPFLFVIILIVGALIKIDDKSDVFYKSHRLGKNGEPFVMYKFRSMKVNAPDIRLKDGSTFNSEHDSRLTKVGKFLRKTSIDELPQLLNVLFGKMSIVGPRPDLLDQISIYEGDEVRKLEALPGITGYNQAYFRNSITVKERFKKDVFYVDNISFSFDIKIIYKTMFVLFQKKNIFTNNMELTDFKK